MAKRANGESSIYKDADGRWHGYVSMGLKENAARDRRHVTGKTRPAVVTKVRDLEQKRDAGLAVAAGQTMTVGAWLDHWLNTIAARKNRPSTVQRYRQLVTNQLRPGVGHHRLDRLQPEQVEELYAKLLDSGLAPATVLQAHRVLSRALKVATQRGKVARNVATLVDAPSAQRSEVEPLLKQEARQIIEAAASSRNSARWSVALSLGLRQGEALGLAWDSVDLAAGTLTVRQALQRQQWKHGCAEEGGCGPAATCPTRRDGGLVLVPPKSRAGRRTIALPGPLIDALKTHRAEQHAERLLIGPAWEDSGLVFCQSNGRPLDPRGDNRAWKALLVKAGVRASRPAARRPSYRSDAAAPAGRSQPGGYADLRPLAGHADSGDLFTPRARTRQRSR